MAADRRTWPLIAAGLTALVCLALGLASLGWQINWLVAPGRLLTAKAGCFRVTYWDPAMLQINYARGLSVEDNDERLRWLPAYDTTGLAHWFWIPLWIPAAAAAGLGAFAWKRRGWPASKCRACGYDLSGLAAGAKLCPECGRPTASQPCRPSQS